VLLQPEHLVAVEVSGMRGQRESEYIVAHDLQDQQRLAGASKVVMPQSKADVGFEPFALLVYA
jgi:hypothetical protein